MTEYVRLALTEKEFNRLLELVGDREDPLVFKLQAKALSHKSKQMAKRTASKATKRAVT